LRSYAERSNYLVSTQAKIIAMTCTHAALKRHDFIKLKFEFDSLVMEEAAQVLEIETFIPLLLQSQQTSAGRLKRAVFIGDHNQLPPVIQNMAFQKYSRMDQSLFARLIRLGVPAVQLNYQGRSRASISRLYNWRYQGLLDMPHVASSSAFQVANAGFAMATQFVNVEDFMGKGEQEPRPYFFQNLGEAEYVVATFMYMRLLGYRADQIVILTSYNGQKALIKDVVAAKCSWHPLIGSPKAIETVDKFQGQQADYVLLSLVRSKAVGHIRDMRRLVVAVSRARLGLYVFGRAELYASCFEIKKTMDQLLALPTELQLLPKETMPSSRKADEVADRAAVVAVHNLADLQSLVGQLLQQAEASATASRASAMDSQ